MGETYAVGTHGHETHRPNEFGIISALTQRFSSVDNVVVGPGDDSAVVMAPDRRVVACTDVLVEGRHFRRDWSSASDVGHRAAAANMADIAAMGASPTALLLGLAAPRETPLTWLQELADGIEAEARMTAAAVVGGDTVSSPTLTISITALGDLRGGEAVRRSGAQAGDLVAYAGRLGWAAAGYTILSRGFRSPGSLVSAHRRPIVSYSAGLAAPALGATAMIDVSDGLLADVGHLGQESGVAIDIDSTRLSVPDAMRNAGKAMGVEPMQWVLTGGEDHALVATFPRDAQLTGDWHVIGQVRAGTGVTVDGRPYGDGPVGWDHFRSS